MRVRRTTPVAASIDEIALGEHRAPADIPARASAARVLEREQDQRHDRASPIGTLFVRERESRPAVPLSGSSASIGSLKFLTHGPDVVARIQREHTPRHRCDLLVAEQRRQVLTIRHRNAVDVRDVVDDGPLAFDARDT